MRRFGYFVLLVMLAACQQSASVLAWVTPGSDSTVSGVVTLSVEPQGAHADAVKGVVFYAGDKELGSAHRAGDTFSLAWDTSRMEPGDYRLRAVPSGGPAVTQVVTVARPSGGGVVATPGTPPASDPDGELDLGDDPLNLGGLIGLWPVIEGTRAADAVMHAPGGFPWESLYPAQKVRAQLRTLLHPAAEEVIKLPRGTYEWNPVLELWEVTPAETGDLQITFSYPDPQTLATHVVEINMLWTRYAPTVVVASGENRVEVPQGARLLVQDNHEDLLDLDIEASWRSLPGCGRVLEPESLTLTGFMEHPRPAETGETAPAQEEGEDEAPDTTLEETDLLFELTLKEAPVRGGETLVTSLEMTTLTEEGFEVKVGWIVAAALELEHEDCVLSGAKLEEMDLYTEVMIGPEEGPYRGSSLSLELSNLVYNDDGIPVGTDMDAELTSFNEESGEETITTAVATVALDEEEGLIAEGEVTLPEGQVVDVTDYIDAIIEAYLERVEDATERESL